MAKRFTDTGKWDKLWYRKLGSKLRDLRAYILDRCDHAGIIELDLETFDHYIGEPVTLDEIKSAFRGKITLVQDKIFIPDFIEFQYQTAPEALNPGNKVHLSVIKRLESLGIFKPLASPLQGAKDKDKDKDKDKKGGVGENKIPESEIHYHHDLNAICDAYPRHESKAKAKQALGEMLAEGVNYDSLLLAAKNFRTHCEKNGIEYKYRKTLPNFLGDGEWKNWINLPPDENAPPDLSDIFGGAS